MLIFSPQESSILIVSTTSATFNFNCVLFGCPGRHDNPEEKLDDEIREQINDSHRFRSFADQRLDNAIKWYVFVHTTNSDAYIYLSGTLTVTTTCMRCLRCLTVQKSVSSYWYVSSRLLPLLARDSCVVTGLVAHP